MDSTMSETQLSDQYIHQSSLKSDPEIKVSSGKLVSYVIDLNQGSYQNGVFTIDATSQINGSVEFACLRDAYIILPYKVSMKNTHATKNNNTANRFCVGLKSGTLTSSIRCRLSSMVKPLSRWQTTSYFGAISVLRLGTALSMLRSMVLKRFYTQMLLNQPSTVVQPLLPETGIWITQQSLLPSPPVLFMLRHR